MSRTEAFLAAVRRRMSTEPLTPDLLASVTAEMLPVDAVGVTTMVEGLRMPLGASVPMALVAEVLQTTLGDGPCLSAARSGTAVIADGPDIARHWPVYGEALARDTPYRAVAAIPLGPPGEFLGALDLYAVQPGLGSRLDVRQVAVEIGGVLATLVAACLVQVPADDDPVAPPPDWYVARTARRHQVWVAVGMLLGCDEPRIPSGAEALARLRAYAYSHGASLDDLAEQLVSGELGTAQILGDPW